jgi:hypothetical protein
MKLGFAMAAVSLWAGGCASTEEARQKEADPPVWLAFGISGPMDAVTRGIRLAPVIRKVEGALGEGAARIAPDGSKLVARSLTSRAPADSAAIREAFGGAGLAAAPLEGDAHSMAMQEMLGGEWLSSGEVYEIALGEVRAKAAGWARRGADALGLSDQEVEGLQEALAAEAVGALGGRADVSGGLQAGWAGIVERAVRKACGDMTQRAQDTIRRAVLAGGP